MFSITRPVRCFFFVPIPSLLRLSHRRIRSHRDRFWAIVDDKLAHPETKLDLQRAADIAGATTSCLLCYEADWQGCHRSRIAGILVRRHGFTMRHLAVRTARQDLPRGSAGAEF